MRIRVRLYKEMSKTKMNEGCSYNFSAPIAIDLFLKHPREGFRKEKKFK